MLMAHAHYSASMFPHLLLVVIVINLIERFRMPAMKCQL